MSKKESVNKNAQLPENLYNYIEGIYKKPNLAKQKKYRERFSSLKDYNLTISEKEELLNLSREKDKDYKILLMLTHIFMEQETQLHQPDQTNSREDALITYIEYVVSHVGNLEKLGNTTIFQEWVDKSDGYGQYAFLCKEIAEIKDGTDKDGKPKVISESQQSHLQCIAAAWLFYKKYVSFEEILRQLSDGLFAVDNNSSFYIEKRSVGFLAKMIDPSSREEFAYLIKYINNKNQEIICERDRYIQKNNQLRKENESLQQELSEFKARFEKTIHELEEAKVTSSKLANELQKTEIEAGHRSIHQKDELKMVKGRIINFLENNILIELNSAAVANSRNPPKSSVVGKKLVNVIDFIGEQLKWLRK